MLAGGDRNGTIRLWDMSAADPRTVALAAVPPGARWLHVVAFTPGGRHLIAGHPGGRVRVFRLAPPGRPFGVPADPRR